MTMTNFKAIGEIVIEISGITHVLLKNTFRTVRNTSTDQSLIHTQNCLTFVIIGILYSGFQFRCSLTKRLELRTIERDLRMKGLQLHFFF